MCYARRIFLLAISFLKDIRREELNIYMFSPPLLDGPYMRFRLIFDLGNWNEIICVTNSFTHFCQIRMGICFSYLKTFRSQTWQFY